MRQKERIINELNRYYQHLYQRMCNGGDYIDSHNCKEGSKEYKMYKGIIDELSKVEELLNYYNRVKSI